MADAESVESPSQQQSPPDEALPDGKDRRRYPRRMPRNKAPLFIYWANSQVSAFIYDISLGGVALFSSYRFKSGDEIAIFVDTRLVSGTFHCKVVWSAEFPTTGRIIKTAATPFRVGLQFVPKTKEEVDSIILLNQLL